MAILKLRDKDGNVYEVPALKGEGDMSASVYDPQGKATDIFAYVEEHGGNGDMMASVYDPQGKATDVFNYIDKKIADIPTPDVSAQIAEHNASGTAHSDIRTLVNSKAPMYTYGTEDLTAGTSELATGTLYFVYE